MAPGAVLTPDIQNVLPPEVTVSNQLTRPCDVLLLYASDMVFSFDHDRFKVFDRIEAGRKVMALTYKIGKAGEIPWSKGWDKYLFLSTSLKNAFVRKTLTTDFHPQTAVLAPPVDLEPFLQVEPKYDGELRIVRHSSQGDVKFPADLPDIMDKCKARFCFMPGPSWLDMKVNVSKIPYLTDPKSVAAFLAKGNVFWYLLPPRYTDQGPRVIVEAMAAGLPVICENRDGPADRLTTETGWKLDSHASAKGCLTAEAIELINSLTPEVIAKKGKAARERAKSEFIREKWFDEIKGK